MRGFDGIAVHVTMLRDRVRTEAYRRAIEAVVKPGDRVLDFGCGTGILSFFASRAGAEVIYAIDRSCMIRHAREIAQANGIVNIRFFKGEAEAASLPERVDVIVSETMGEFLFPENGLEPLIALRERWLKPGGRVVPARIRLRAALVGDPGCVEEKAFLRGRPYGVDYSAIADWPLHETMSATLVEEQLLFDPVTLAELDLLALDVPPTVVFGTVRPSCDADVYALCGWFEAVLAPGVELGTGPNDIRTTWSQVVFPLPRTFRARAGRNIEISFQPVYRGGQDPMLWRWSIADDLESIEMDEIVLPAWHKRPLPDGWLA